jgi:oxygen-independent coproporphyrinogen-3 oxidase
MSVRNPSGHGAEVLRQPELPPLSLYVHLPWCVHKCPYCDFNSHTAPASTPRQRYLEALLADLGIEALRAGGRKLISVFLGGGTPSLFTPGEIHRLLDGVRDSFAVSADAEITLEANPGTVECGDPAGYRSAGVNRLSIGAQSFSDESLKRLGRIHAAVDIERAITAARAAGFLNVNLDLMYALPGQTVDAALADIRAAVRLGPAHISWYQLTLEPNTIFFACPPSDLPDADQCYAIQCAGQALLNDSGYRQYEISAYSRAGMQSIHNYNYWSFGDYLAVGAGAHGKISTPVEIYRYEKPRNPERYMQAAERGELAPGLIALSDSERLFEFMLNATRLTEGFDQALFQGRTGLRGTALRDWLGTAIDKGLIREVRDRRWQPTPLGRRFLNDLQATFLPERGE